MDTDAPKEPGSAKNPTETPATETVTSPENGTSTHIPTVSDALQAVYDMVSALPKAEDISDENHQNVQEQVTQITKAYATVIEEEQAAFDASEACTKLYAVNDALTQDVPKTYSVTAGDSGVYVGGVQLKTDRYYLAQEGTVVDGRTADNYNVYFNGSALTLNNAVISKLAACLSAAAASP